MGKDKEENLDSNFGKRDKEKEDGFFSRFKRKAAPKAEEVAPTKQFETAQDNKESVDVNAIKKAANAKEYHWYASKSSAVLKIHDVREAELQEKGEKILEDIDTEKPAKVAANEARPWHWFEESDPFPCCPCLKIPFLHYISTVPFLWLRSCVTYHPGWKVEFSQISGVFTLGEIFVAWPILFGLIIWCALSNNVDGTATPATWAMGLTYATVSHNSLWTYFLGLPFERTLRYHKMAAWATIITGTWHGILGTIENERLASGWLLQGSFYMLILTSLPPIRRRLFNVFLYCHYIFFGLAFVVSFIHGAGGQFFGSILYIADLVIRYIWQQLFYNHVCEIVALPANVIRLTFKKSPLLRYKAGQYFFIMIPMVTPFEWHPFSISSCPSDEYVCIHIRVLGNWTRRLYNMAKKKGSEGKPWKTVMCIEGSVGEPSVSVYGPRYKCFLFVSGGIGITPMQSICNEILHQHKRGRPVKQIYFVWSVRDSFLISSMYDKQYQHTTLPTRAPASFQPDLLLRHRTSKNVWTKESHCEGPTPAFVSQKRLETQMKKDLGIEIAEEEKENDKPKVVEMNGANIDTEDDDPLHVEFYLTRRRDPNEYAEAKIDPKVQETLYFQRPDLPAVFKEMARVCAAKGEHRVAVLTCGPPALIKTCQKLSFKQSLMATVGKSHRVWFDFHSEEFDF